MAHKSAGGSLKNLCFLAVREHFLALGTEAVVSLPTHLIKDLLPHLTICQLDEIQPALNQRGISTYSRWLAILEDLRGRDYAIKFPTEDEAKQEVLTWLFPSVLYGYRNPYIIKNLSNLNTSFLWAAAKCIQHFLCKACHINTQKVFQSLTSGPQPLLNIFEKRIRNVTITDSMDLLKETTQHSLYILHRLLDHGAATKLTVSIPNPIMLAWLLHGRGSHYVNPELKNLMDSSCVSQTSPVSEDGAGCSPGLMTRASDNQGNEIIPFKRSRLDSACLEDASGNLSFTVDSQVICQNFAHCEVNSAVPCTLGQIEALNIYQCGSDSLRILVSSLPTFFSLQSLSLHSSKFSKSNVLDLVSALKQLSDSSCGKLTDLTISFLPTTNLIEKLLDASNTVTSLHVEVRNIIEGPQILFDVLPPAESQVSAWPVQRLTVKVHEFQSDLNFMTYVLRRSPHLTSLHLAGMRLPTGSSLSPLLTTLSEFNHSLRTLILEDMKLSNCLPEILNLLRNCKLEELRFDDCRLLETCSNKEQTLLELVTALRKVSSLRTLSLAQNRLARNVCVLAELFSGSPSSSVNHLDISSNFIKPADLLEFAKRLTTHQPPYNLSLDLRKNPANRDPDTWSAALQKLRSFTLFLSMGWKSTDMMVDHISNM
ncbi:uncharacterized protein lrrc41 isoform X2 [Melanotaenia boesemani]|uniref:uncharacterized protein lrrc41 isoform X2 n=1 Tax=Melanotaenia boesemani TaxID=1250792 RepID=UPI001C056063|nr:uncharacterized protein lrrc41 isoform X2 [Melanotaenia boesemani]